MKLAASALLLVAVSVHVAVAWQYAESDPFASTLVADALSYDRQADRIAGAGLASEEVFHQSPLFPLILSAVYRLVADERRGVAALVLQSGLNLLALAGMALVTARTLGRRAAFAAALCGLAFTPFVFYATKLLPLPLALATQSWGLVAVIEARRRSAPVWCAWAGLAWGVACIARAEMLVFVPVAVAAVAAGRRRRFLATVLCLAGFALAIAPITAHNARNGDRVLIASAGGENLFIGNQVKGRGGYSPLDPRAGDLFSQRGVAREIAEGASGGALTPSEISAFWRGRALHEITSNPRGWLLLEARKLGRLLHPGDPTDLYSMSLERSHFLWVLWLLPLSTWPILLLATVGIAGLRERRASWPIAALAVTHACLLLIFFVDARLRVPLVWCLCPFAGAALAELVGRWRRFGRREVALASALLATIVVGLAVARPEPRDAVRLASVLSRQQRLEAGLEVLQPFLDRAHPDAYVLDQAGWLHQKREAWERAASSYRAALASGLAPARARQTRTRLGIVLERIGHFGEAQRAHDAAAADPFANAGTFYERGMFRIRRGDRAGGIDDLRHATELDPRWPAPRSALRSLGASR